MNARPDIIPIKVAILWHMHQPNYREPHSNRLSLPWVRLHALKDYLDMPLHATANDRVKVTFNLVPSLLDQIEMYLNGAIDRHLELSRLRAEDLGPGLKVEILDSFFSANPDQMIKPFQRYWELYNKARRGDAQKHVIASFFSSSEIRDLQVWSNLAWVDPLFRTEPVIKMLFAKGKQYSEEDKQALLDWQFSHMKRIIPTYRELLEQNRIDISFTPYFHPILPLLCDTDSAKEALPDILLPHRRFSHPEDAIKQIQMSRDHFRNYFGRELTGMWPSEGSVSGPVLDLMIQQGIKWAATDEEVLFHSLLKGGQERGPHHAHTMYEYNSSLKLFFRDRSLSDRIGFVYSGWRADKAVSDFVSHVLDIREKLKDNLHNTLISVILDGENAWEYFPDDGTEFLSSFYQALQDEPRIETVTMSDASTSISPKPLKAIFAGSWINHNFRVWIGHPEDNAAWDVLKQTRDILVQFEHDHPDYDRERLAAAWLQIYIAEGSDWCWWYGDDHRTTHIDQFDRTYRRHLAAVYEHIGIDVPESLKRPLLLGAITSYSLIPENLITPTIDGQISHFYEWTGAGYFDSLKAGGAMHQSAKYIGTVHAGFDRDHVYIRLDFHNKMGLDLLISPRIVLELTTPETLVFELTRGVEGFAGDESGVYSFRMNDILEISINRRSLWSSGAGQLKLKINLFEQDQKLESCPEGDGLSLTVPEPNNEVFWPT